MAGFLRARERERALLNVVVTVCLWCVCVREKELKMAWVGGVSRVFIFRKGNALFMAILLYYILL